MELKLKGKIIKGIAGFYYVHIVNKGVFECKAKGGFRNDGIKPLVGDNVCISIVDNDKLLGHIEEILPRTNEIIRPSCSNIDMAVIIMALSKPEPKLSLLDKLLIFFEYYEIPILVCFNKKDEVENTQIELLKNRYKNAGIEMIFTSAKNGDGIKELKDKILNKTIILTGPSGVGKSSILNYICELDTDIGEISKIGRGKHTTRHSEIYNVYENTYIMDTPGFSAIDIPKLQLASLRHYFNEFNQYEGKCRFDECVHLKEPNCAVKEALEKGQINKERYNSYKVMYELLEKDEILGKKFKKKR